MTMLAEAKQTYGYARSAHWSITHLIEELRVKTRGSVDLDTLVDTVYALKETSKLLDAVRKEANRLVESLERDVCKLWVATSQDGEPIRTEHCTGSPDVKSIPKTPKHGTPEYAAFCQHFGVDPDGPFTPHWNRVTEQLAKDQAEGRPMPPGLDPAETWTVCKVKIFKREPVLSADEAVPVCGLESLAAIATVFKLLEANQLKEAREAYLHTILSDDAEELDAAPIASIEEETPF